MTSELCTIAGFILFWIFALNDMFAKMLIVIALGVFGFIAALKSYESDKAFFNRLLYVIEMLVSGFNVVMGVICWLLRK